MAGTNSPWLFPQMRKRNADDDGDGTMAEGAPGRAMQDAGVGFTPHAVRRAFAGWAEDIGKFDIKKVQAVLDHAEGRQDVLRKRYSRSEQIALKTEPLEKWAEFVLAHVRRRRPDDRKDDLPACMCGGGESPDTGDDGDYVEGQARIVRPQFG